MRILFAILLISLTGCAEFNHNWTPENRKLEWTYQTIHAIDALQTLQVENHPELRETNPLLGSHPTKGKILVWYMASAYGHAFTTDALDSYAPRWVCRTWHVVMLADAASAVYGNYQLGIRVGF